VTRLLVHLDKVILAALVALVATRIYADIRDLCQRQAEQATCIADARRIASKTLTSEIEIPAQDPNLHSELVLRGWSRLASGERFQWYMLYPLP
jgi:hypothetical protein